MVSRRGPGASCRSGHAALLSKRKGQVLAQGLLAGGKDGELSHRLVPSSGCHPTMSERLSQPLTWGRIPLTRVVACLYWSSACTFWAGQLDKAIEGTDGPVVLREQLLDVVRPEDADECRVQAVLLVAEVGPGQPHAVVEEASYKAMGVGSQPA